MLHVSDFVLPFVVNSQFSKFAVLIILFLCYSILIPANCEFECSLFQLLLSRCFDCLMLSVVTGFHC